MLVRWKEFDDAFRTFDLFSRDVSRWIDPSLTRRFAERGAYHVAETESGYTLTVDLPGVADDALKVTLTDGVLDIAAERTLEPAEGFQKRFGERSGYKYAQRFALPEHVDESKVTAALKDGVLTIELAKGEKAKPRTIAVNH